METVQNRNAWAWVSLIFLALIGTHLSGCGGDRLSKAASSTNLEQSALSSNSSEDETLAAPKTDRPYIDRLLPESQRISKEFGVPVDTTLAIAIYETGWGKFEIGQNNHFGLRCASDDCTVLNKNGKDIRYETCPDESECFDMFARSIVDLSNGQPGNLSAIYQNGYATSPSWVRQVRQIRRQVRQTLQKAGVEREE